MSTAMFSGFTDAEKRTMSEWNRMYLESEKERRKGNVAVHDMTGASKLLHRLSVAQINRLIEVTKLYSKADGTSGNQAISIYKRIASLAPWDEVCLMSIGVEYAQAGNFGEGVRWLEKAQALNPGNARVRQNLQSVKAAAGR